MLAIRRAIALMLFLALLMPTAIASASTASLSAAEASPAPVEPATRPGLAAPPATRPGTATPAKAAPTKAAAKTAPTKAASKAAPTKRRPTSQINEWYRSIEETIVKEVYPIGLKLLMALGILIGGWIVAKLVSALVYRGLCATTLDDKLAKWLRLDILLEAGDGPKPKNQIERFFAGVVYWILMAIVFIATLQYSGFSQAAAPLQTLLDTIFGAIPHLLKALFTLGLFFAAAYVLKVLTVKGLQVLKADARFNKLSGQTEGSKFSDNVGNVIFGVIALIGLASFFDALNITPISAPLHNAIDRIIGILPSVGVALLILLAGWVISRAVREILGNVLSSLGLDALFERIKLASLFGEWKASGTVAAVVGFFIMLQAALAAVNELGLETLSQPITDMMTQFWMLLPKLLVSILIIAIGVVIGRVLREVISTALRNFGFDKIMGKLGLGVIAKREDKLGEPSELVGFAVQAAVVLLATSQALNNLSLAAWATYLDTFLSWSFKHVLVALLILGIGFAVGNYVRDIIEARQEASGEASTPWMGLFARSIVLVFASTMAIHQLGVAEDFVLLTFGLMFGALCLAAALAFGLGSRDVAGEIIRGRYDRAKAENKAKGVAKGGNYDSGYFAPPTTGKPEQGQDQDK